MKKIIISLITCLFCIGNILCASTETLEAPPQTTEKSSTWDQIVDYARANLPQEGYLQSQNGFIYLKVNDNYIHTLFPMLNLNGYREPPYFRRHTAPGAHISVIYSDENVIPDEIGKKFSFKLKQIILVHPNKYTSYAVLEVESPELEQLRKKYGLSSKLKNHEFHISLAKKVQKKFHGDKNDDKNNWNVKY